MRTRALNTSPITNINVVEAGYLHGTMTVGGTSLHVYFIEVAEVGGIQVAASTVQQQRFEELGHHDPGRYETLTIEGRTFAVFATPYHD